MDIGASNWSETDASNSQPSPDGAPEGMFPSGVNDTIRAVMGAVKRWFNWSSPKITGGSATAYTLTYGVAPGALIDGMTHLLRFHAGNGVGATLNVNGLGAKPLYAYSRGAWYQAPPGLFDVDTVCQVTYDAGTGVYRLLMPGTIATGMIVPDAGSTAPAGYLQCFGQAIPRANYPGLFAVVGTTYGAGDGSTTFNVPDLRGIVVAGRDNMGGTSANRLSSVMASTTLGAAGGQQTESAGVSVSVNVSVGGSASGTLTGATGDATAGAFGNAVGGGEGGPFSVYSHAHNFVSVSGSLGVSASGSGSGSGGTNVVSNVQPTIILNQIIKL
jgi:microcystin-dependent protein